MKSTVLAITCFLISIGIIVSSCRPLYEHDVIPNAEIAKTIEMVEKVIYCENGVQEIIDMKSEVGMEIVDLLARTLHGINAVLECSWTEEQVQEMREKGRCIELIFRSPKNIKISRRIEMDNGKEYQILEDKSNPLFLLEEDSLFQCGKGTILVDYETAGGDIHYGGMSIIVGREGSGELDESWVYKLEELINQLPE